MKKLIIIIALVCTHYAQASQSNIAKFITQLCKQQVYLHEKTYNKFCQPYITKLLHTLQIPQLFEQSSMRDHTLAEKYYDLLVRYNKYYFKNQTPRKEYSHVLKRLENELMATLNQAKAEFAPQLDVQKELATTLNLCKKANKQFALLTKPLR